MQDPFVTIIIPTCNRPFLLRHCIEHVLAQPYPRKEIIVVDSSSNDQSERAVACYPEVISVRIRGQRNNRPTAKNTGMTYASGDLICFLDDDAMVCPTWLDTVLEIHQDDTVGAAGGRVVRAPRPYADQESGPPHMTVTKSGRVIWEGADLVSTERVDVDHLISCNVSFRRDALEQVGGFDPNYTITSLREETDLCIRVKKAGWRLVYEPKMEVTHYSARSQGYFMRQPVAQFSSGRNGVYFAIKQCGLTPQVLVDQLIVEPGKNLAKASSLAAMFMVGASAQIVGRAVGLGVGLKWMMNRKMRENADPKIRMRDRPVSEVTHESIADEDKSLV
ncbi:MAG TPA: glycosyltransferase [Ktedonobacteraceae bacterium]|jgi:GT2 family glycosyltransferase|nr:glycosyltransferase [Ktedonobacteraceae bacterium]